MKKARSDSNLQAREKKAASRVPLVETGKRKNAVEYSEILRRPDGSIRRVHEHTNTAGHIQGIADAYPLDPVRLVVTASYSLYTKWCEENGEAVLVRQGRVFQDDRGEWIVEEVA